MKKINTYIIEKLKKINSKTKVKDGEEFFVIKLNCANIYLYRKLKNQKFPILHLNKFNRFLLSEDEILQNLNDIKGEIIFIINGKFDDKLDILNTYDHHSINIEDISIQVFDIYFDK